MYDQLPVPTLGVANTLLVYFTFQCMELNPLLLLSKAISQVDVGSKADFPSFVRCSKKLLASVCCSSLTMSCSTASYKMILLLLTTAAPWPMMTSVAAHPSKSLQTI